VPLGDGPPGVGQHISPVSQASPTSCRSHRHPPDGFVLAQLVIVQHCQLHLDLLGWMGGKGDRRVREGGMQRGGSGSPAKDISL
jgi:hypothetical protein